jgi:hypothetical protein
MRFLLECTMHLLKLSTTLLLGCVLSLAGQGAFAQQTAPPLQTRIKLLTPWQPPGLSIGLAVTQQVNGTCFTRSLASPSRPDAWRCMAGNGLMDPCYQRIMGDEKQLACPVGGPWPANVVLLTLTQPLPQEDRKEPSRDSVLPWALELVNGQKCTQFTGATAPVAGMRINYGCPGGFTVVGDIDRSQPIWHVFFQGEKSIALEQVDVAVAWF